MQGLDYTEQIHRIISHIILYAGFWRRQRRRQDLARRGAQNYMEIGLSKVTHTHKMARYTTCVKKRYRFHSFNKMKTN